MSRDKTAYCLVAFFCQNPKDSRVSLKGFLIKKRGPILKSKGYKSNNLLSDDLP